MMLLKTNQGIFGGIPLFLVLGLGGCGWGSATSLAGAAPVPLLVRLGGPSEQTRRLQGVGLASAGIRAARVSVQGVDMLQVTRSVAWDGQSPLQVPLQVPSGAVRLITLEALSDDPASPSVLPIHFASLRAVAQVDPSASNEVSLNYNSDASGRVVQSLLDGLKRGFQAPDFNPQPAEAQRENLLVALRQTDQQFVTRLQAFVGQLTQYQAPDATHPSGSYGGVHPLYFNADHLAKALAERGPAVLQAPPPQPLDAFRASGRLVLHLDSEAGLPSPSNLLFQVQTPFAQFFEDGLFFKDTATPYLHSGTSDWAVQFQDLPPGWWGLSLRNKVGVSYGPAGTHRVRAGLNEATTLLSANNPAFTSGPFTANTGSLFGQVFNEENQAISGASVQVHVLSTGQLLGPMSTATDGSFGFLNLPANTQMEVLVLKDGHTSRKRVVSVLPNQPGQVDFGGSSGPEAAAAFISDRPEVMETTPAEDATGVDPSLLRITATLSEVLDANNRLKFERALALVPANPEACPDFGASVDVGASTFDLEGSAFDLQGLRSSSGALPPLPLRSQDFYCRFDQVASATWSADFKQLVLTLSEPLPANLQNAAKYNVALFQEAGEPIRDASGYPLGTKVASMSLSEAPDMAGGLIANAFKASVLQLQNVAATPFARWDDTHDNASSFEMGLEDSVLQVVSVAASTEAAGTDTQFVLAFNRSMRSMLDTSGQPAFLAGLSASSFTNNKTPLSYFTFAVGKTGKLKDVDLKGGSDVKAEVFASGVGIQAVLTDRNIAANSLGSTVVSGQEEEFQLSDSTYRWTGRSGAGPGDVVIEGDPNDRRRVIITIIGRTLRQVFDTEMAEIKVRVEGVRDVSGQVINKASADRHVVTGRI